MTTPVDLLAQSLDALRNANRIDGTRASYRKDNPTEYAEVSAYLDGGARPTGTLTLMGQGLVLEEDARRELTVTTPPPPPVSAYDLPAKFQVFGLSTEDAKTLDFAVTSFVTDVDAHVARQSSPGLVIVSHPSLDPFKPDYCFKRGHAWTYGAGLAGGASGVECRDAGKSLPPWPGVNDTLAPSPQGQIRGWQDSDWGCTQGDNNRGYALFNDPTADFMAKLLFYAWKVGKFSERGYNGLWSDNLVPGNLLHAGWFYGTCADATRRDAWDRNLLKILRHIRSNAGVPIRLGGNMIYAAADVALRAETNIALRELIYDYTIPTNFVMGRSTDVLWNDILTAQAWLDTPSVDGQPKLLAANARVQRGDLAMQRAVCAVACIYGASFNCYDPGHGDTFWPDVTFKDGKRGYLGKPIAAPQRSGDILSRRMERGTVTYDHVTRAVSFI